MNNFDLIHLKRKYIKKKLFSSQFDKDKGQELEFLRNQINSLEIFYKSQPNDKI